MNVPNPPPAFDGLWNLYFIYGTAALYWEYSVIFYSDPYTPNTPTHVCQTASLADVTITPYLEDSLPSPNAVITFFNAKTGQMYASSVASSLKMPNLTGTWTLETSPNITVSQLGTFLLSRFGSYASITENMTMTATLSDGKQWYIGVSPIAPDNYNNWLIVVAFPRADFFAQRRRSGDYYVVRVVACQTTEDSDHKYRVTHADEVQKYLKQYDGRPSLTRTLNHSELEDGQLEHRNIITEIGSLENSFATMVKAFAVGLKKNAELVRGTGGSNIPSKSSLGNAPRTTIGATASASNQDAILDAQDVPEKVVA
ncbi:hypothetical protein BDK51DRAFT_38271 [Blyttiomyces helicus]|uniref:Uncharacterized protein n=1 Tax=Blyttiomyces helicus TaxID=388810 RepID=A0A4P9VZ94_9FUNG|nr:hypothetical protein BDK51DRAFT_38271 [Blyttiomyces helicus]|eukprot:RKO83136.1 hypothetical protein BDK51DRAFT_38271 [Blyttiomyces helicus]